MNRASASFVSPSSYYCFVAIVYCAMSVEHCVNVCSTCEYHGRGVRTNDRTDVLKRNRQIPRNCLQNIRAALSLS